MLPKTLRARRSDLETVFSCGSVIHSPHITFRIFANKNKNKKLSVVIGSKTEKKSVVRNRLKRIGRHIIAKNITHVAPGITGVFFLKKGVSGLSGREFEKEIITLLRRGSLYVSQGH